MKEYTSLIFDAFDTVLHINRLKLPVYKLNGKTIYTTAPAVQSVYSSHFGSVDPDIFYAAFAESYIQTEQIRRDDLKEVTSQERFRTMLGVLGHHTDSVPMDILTSLTLAHMNQLQESFEVRPETMAVLEWAAPRYRRAMISNFDYAPGLYEALDRFGIRSEFETIMVSDEVGWRKPHPLIFEKTFAIMGIHPTKALFIGDQLYLDVFGGIQAGMDVVWLENGRETWTDEFPKPTYTVRSMDEIIPILENDR